MSADRAEKCRSCGARIYWATMEESGKLAPINVDEDPSGTCVLRAIVEKGQIIGLVCRVVALDGITLPGERRRTSHFATCPNANSHRKPPPASATSNPAPASATSNPAPPPLDPARVKPTLEKLLVLVAGRADALNSMANDCAVALDTEAADMLQVFQHVIPWRGALRAQALAAQAVEHELLRLLYAANGGRR